jgi:hypothetical protein
VGVIALNVVLTGFLVMSRIPRNTTPVQAVPGGEQKVPVEERITVMVFNGCGVNGVAQQTRRFLEDHNFNVVGHDNHANFNVQRTVVVDHFSVQKERARKVASVLGLGEEAVVPKLDPKSAFQVSVILGRDYLRLTPFRQ